ncbi:hypothetical protein [Cohnella cholangitidis]|uniref:Uncharacterized protein n=1 Tax=Cohnella cholangitidis TaxID=2598458 RepID=A0A7G5BX05_9BACL|nr:hypothetical protein [Cohnella cholangitidis]QMV41489.1 hypothetical protein FPL14_10000 [Cohnella cholangitidis]
MIRRSAVMLALIAMIMGLVSGFSSSSAWAASGNPVATYLSPEKIEFVSYSKKWNQKKLKALYVELMKNTHGEELRYLGKVVLSPEEKEDELGVANMGYSWTEDDLSDIEMDEPTEIILYDADNLSTVESLSTTLSHEYGHHFTYYWLIKKEHKLPSDSTTKWAAIRGIQNYPVLFTEDTSDPEYTHYWDPGEIMADDYMAMFGSPTAKLSMVKSHQSQEGRGFYGEIENESLPPATTLASVRSYWLKLSGIKDPLPLVFKEPKLTKIQAVESGEEEEGIDHKLTFEAGSAAPAVAGRLQYSVYWTYEDEGEETFDYTDLTTGKRYLVVPGGLPETELTLTVYAYDPKTRQYVYARPVTYDLSDPEDPILVN